jgi:hypothetical protein
MKGEGEEKGVAEKTHFSINLITPCVSLFRVVRTKPGLEVVTVTPEPDLVTSSDMPSRRIANTTRSSIYLEQQISGKLAYSCSERRYLGNSWPSLPQDCGVTYFRYPCPSDRLW